MSSSFDDIRPFNDDEYHAVVNELLEVEPLQKALQYYIPNTSLSDLKVLMNSFKSVQEFQSNIACRIVQGIIDYSIEEFTFDGILKLDKEETYLLMSNHRDIVLDSALINYCLDTRNYNTCEIAIGSNLLSQPWIKNLVRLNKSFIVKRNIPKQDMLEASKNLSAYIYHALKNKRQSLWIAQREGRAKDGNDKTNPGLLKMFALSNEGDLLDYLISLNITPVSISYEIDPCDYLKIPELIAKSKEEVYQKAEGEDVLHMALGMKENKGRTHFQFCQPINEELKQFSEIKNRNELLKNVAELIDATIYKNYKLWSTNYIAYDLLHQNDKYSSNYSPDEKQMFIEYTTDRLKDFTGNDLAFELFYKMYANPVINFEKVI